MRCTDGNKERAAFGLHQFGNLASPVGIARSQQEILHLSLAKDRVFLKGRRKRRDISCRPIRDHALKKIGGIFDTLCGLFQKPDLLFQRDAGDQAQLIGAGFQIANGDGPLAGNRGEAALNPQITLKPARILMNGI